MAKSKAQKQQEARWRELRGELLRDFQSGNDEKVRQEYGEWLIDRREQRWLDYLALPREWREHAMDGMRLPDNLRARLELAAVEQHAGDLQEATAAVEAPRRRMRL